MKILLVHVHFEQDYYLVGGEARPCTPPTNMIHTSFTCNPENGNIIDIICPVNSLRVGDDCVANPGFYIEPADDPTDPSSIRPCTPIDFAESVTCTSDVDSVIDTRCMDGSTINSNNNGCDIDDGYFNNDGIPEPCDPPSNMIHTSFTCDPEDGNIIDIICPLNSLKVGDDCVTNPGYYIEPADDPADPSSIRPCTPIDFAQSVTCTNER